MDDNWRRLREAAPSMPSIRAQRAPQQPSFSASENALVAISEQVSRLLSHYWTSIDSTISRQLQIEDWLADLREFPLAAIAEACREWRRQPGGRRPTPGDIRALCIEHRQPLNDDLPAPNGMPRWMADHWHSHEERNQAIAAQEQRYRRATELRAQRRQEEHEQWLQSQTTTAAEP